MPFFPIGLPQPLAIRGPFAALTIDAQRRRIVAAGARSVAVLDADTGKLLATVRIGGTRSIAIEPLGGHIFVATRDGRISEVDPDRKTIVRSLDAGGVADVLSYDAATGRLYADGDHRAEREQRREREEERPRKEPPNLRVNVSSSHALIPPLM